MMRLLAILGVLLILGGLAALVTGDFSFTTAETVLDIGPIEATADRERTVAIPTTASVAAMVAGAFLVFVGQGHR
ncbi:hypothetical protein [Rhodospirillaceae bacterium SYSU D60014]|uniref:hypothetical protein n=1 Tax=Virgifigura deserti TaxID=2268457 RepID=UPI000E66B8ED